MQSTLRGNGTNRELDERRRFIAVKSIILKSIENMIVEATHVQSALPVIETDRERKSYQQNPCRARILIPNNVASS